MSASSTRRPLPALIVLAMLTLLTAVVWWRVLHRSDAKPASLKPTPSATVNCTPVNKPTTFPNPADVHVRVLNGARIDGLAAQVGSQLTARHFVVAATVDGPAAGGAAELHYGVAGAAGATLLKLYFPGAATYEDNRTDPAVDVLLGSGFQIQTSLAAQSVVENQVARLAKGC